MEVPDPPAELRVSGRRLWLAVLGEYELEQHETGLLTELCRTADALDGLQEIVNRDGLMFGIKVHPALVEARQLRIAYARLTAALRLPAGEEDGAAAKGDLRRPQRRVGVRQPYGIRRVA